MEAPRNVTFPYVPPIAFLGGVPNITTDVPILSVFLLLFVGGAITHMAIFQVNNRKDPRHFFLLSALTFGFCMSRIVTIAMRLAWATHPDNIQVSIASSVLNSAGTILLFIINLIFAERILRSLHPKLQEHTTLHTIGKFYIGSVVAVLVILITSVVYGYYTLDPTKQSQFAAMRKFGVIYFTVFSASGMLITLAAIAFPSDDDPVPFGKKGGLRSQVLIVLLASTLLTFGAAFRAGTTFLTPRPASNPAWYHSKAAFYCVYFVVEILVVYLYAIMRVDHRFYVPDKKDRLAAKAADREKDSEADSV